MYLAKKTNHKTIILALAASIVFPLAMQAGGFQYAILLGCYVQLYIIAVSGLDILFGYSGQISMGHAGFYAIGAYGSALLHNHFNMPIMLSILLACVISGIVGTIIAIPASKLVFHFLSLATIAFGEIIYNIASHSPNNITGNFRGMFTDRFSIFGFELKSNISVYFFGLLCVILFLLVKTRIVDSKLGRAFIAIRENEHSANGMGVDVHKYKVLAFTISAVFTAFAGSFYAHLVGYLSPDTFVQKQSVMFVTMLLFGGSASVQGNITGVLVILILTEALRAFKDYQMVIYGVLMIIAIVALPGGLYGGFKDIVQRVKGKKTRDGKGAA